MYPDCRSLREKRHLKELILASANGIKGIIVFTAGFPRAKAFTPYDKADPIIRQLLGKAIPAGVKVKAIGVHYNLMKKSIVLYNNDFYLQI